MSTATVRVAVEGTDLQFDQEPDDTILRAALRAGIGVPYECNSGGCGSCRFQVVDGEVVDLWPDAPGRSDRDRRSGRMLACQSSAASDLTVRCRVFDEYVPVVRPERRRARVTTISPVTHDMRRIVLRTSAPARFAPGQYLSVSLRGVTGARNYSMGNLANDDGDWELVVRRVPGGRATGVLFDDLAVGDDIEIDGPYGLATLRTDNDRDIACVAGGSGLAPMLSIARGAAAAGMLEARVLHFFYGARTPADVCGAHELDALATAPGRVQFHPVVSTPAAEHGQQWDGPTGFVHDAAVGTLGEDLARFEWYCAGPPPMTQALQRALTIDSGVPVGQVHFDRFF